MKIDEISQSIEMIRNPKENIVNRQTEENRSQSTARDKGKDTVTEVDFSDTSVEYSKVAKAVASETGERTELINDIKQRIENGTYVVDSDKVADKIIKETLTDLLNS